MQVLSVLTQLWPFLVGVPPVLLVLFAWRRAGSAHFLIDRIWRLVGGEADFKDERLVAHWSEVKELESFGFRTGIRPDDRAQLNNILTFLESTGASLTLLIRARHHFNPTTCCISVPSRLYRFGIALIAPLFIVPSFLLSIWMMSSDQTLLKIRTSSTYLIASENSARSPLPWQWNLHKSQCSDGEPHESLKKKDREVICNLLTTDDGKKLILESISDQTKTAVPFLAFNVIAAIWLVLTVYGIDAALRLKAIADTNSEKKLISDRQAKSTADQSHAEAGPTQAEVGPDRDV